MSRWLTDAPTENADQAHEEEVIDTTPTGPVRPILGVPPPPREEQLPFRVQPNLPRGEHWYLGVHGGAGETTLAALDPHGREAHHEWPSHTFGHRVVLVARDHAYGLARLNTALQHWHAGELPNIDVLGAVVIPAAPGRLAKPLRDLRYRATSGAPITWALPWEPRYLAETDPTNVPTPRETARTIRAIQALSEGDTE